MAVYYCRSLCTSCQNTCHFHTAGIFNFTVFKSEVFNRSFKISEKSPIIPVIIRRSVHIAYLVIVTVIRSLEVIRSTAKIIAYRIPVFQLRHINIGCLFEELAFVCLSFIIYIISETFKVFKRTYNVRTLLCAFPFKFIFFAIAWSIACHIFRNIACFFRTHIKYRKFVFFKYPVSACKYFAELFVKFSVRIFNIRTVCLVCAFVGNFNRFIIVIL